MVKSLLSKRSKATAKKTVTSKDRPVKKTTRIRTAKKSRKENEKENLLYLTMRLKGTCPRCGETQILAEVIGKRGHYHCIKCLMNQESTPKEVTNFILNGLRNKGLIK